MLSLSLLALAAFGQNDSSAPRTQRRYDQGPLRAAEFRGERPPTPLSVNHKPLDAYTVTDIRYRYEFLALRHRGRTTAKLTEIDVYSVFDRTQSWNVKQQDAKLLDHEQGHFDITEAHARMALLELEGRRAIAGRGRTEGAAVRALDSTIRELLQPFVEANRRSHAEYDRITKHGHRRAAQTEQRQQQRNKLEQLAHQLEQSQRRERRRRR